MACIQEPAAARRRSARAWALWPMLGAVAIVGCNAIFGIDDRSPIPDGVGGGGGAVASSSGGSAGAPPADCTTADDCASGFCVDSTCCDSACAGVCEACNVAGSEGLCNALPAASDPDDECVDGTCDGAGRCASGAHLWSLRRGGALIDYGLGVAVDRAGDIFVTGTVATDVDFGGGLLTTAGGFDVFVAKFDSAGGHVWSMLFGGLGTDVGSALALDSNDNIIIVGSHTADVNFGGSTLVSLGLQNAFVLKLDPNGAHLHSVTFGAAGSRIALGVAVGLDDSYAVVGDFRGTIDFGDGPSMTMGTNDADLFVAKFDAQDNYRWSGVFGAPSICTLSAIVWCDSGTGIGVDDAGDVFIAGRFSDTIDFGGEPLQSAGDNDVFVAKLDAATGDRLWSKRFGDAGRQFGRLLALDQQGNVHVVGTAAGSVDFGGGVLTADQQDAFVVALSSSGEHLWSRLYGTGGVADALAIRVDDVGNAIVSGIYVGDVDLGGGALPWGPPEPNGTRLDAFVMKVAASGQHLWSQGFGAARHDDPRQLALTPAGEIVVIGDFELSVGLGGPTLISAGETDVFLAKFAP